MKEKAFDKKEKQMAEDREFIPAFSGRLELEDMKAYIRPHHIRLNGRKEPGIVNVIAYIRDQEDSDNGVPDFLHLAWCPALNGSYGIPEMKGARAEKIGEVEEDMVRALLRANAERLESVRKYTMGYEYRWVMFHDKKARKRMDEELVAYLFARRIWPALHKAYLAACEGKDGSRVFDEIVTWNSCVDGLLDEWELEVFTRIHMPDDDVFRGMAGQLLPETLPDGPVGSPVGIYALMHSGVLFRAAPSLPEDEGFGMRLLDFDLDLVLEDEVVRGAWPIIRDPMVLRLAMLLTTQWGERAREMMAVTDLPCDVPDAAEVAGILNAKNRERKD